MEFLNTHLQLALLNSSQKPFKSIIKKYPYAFCDENELKSLIYNTMFNLIEQVERKNKIFESFSHLERYFYSSMWNAVSEIYEDEKVYSMECVQLNYEELALRNYDQDVAGFTESAEDEFTTKDSYQKLCNAIHRLEATELRNRAIRGLKRSPFLKTIKMPNMNESLQWYFKQISQAELLNEEQLAVTKALHELAKKNGEFTSELLDSLAQYKQGILVESEIKRLCEISQAEDRTSNFYGFATRFINQANIHNSLFDGTPESSRLISGQRNMIRNELRHFRRG